MTMPTVERIETEAGKRYRVRYTHSRPWPAGTHSMSWGPPFATSPWPPTAVPASARSRA